MGRTGFTLLILGSAALLKPTHLVRVWVGPVLSFSTGLNFLPAVKPPSPSPEPALGSLLLQQLWLTPSKTLFLHFS